jgi:hypothetical protein
MALVRRKRNVESSSSREIVRKLEKEVIREAERERERETRKVFKRVRSREHSRVEERACEKAWERGDQRGREERERETRKVFKRVSESKPVHRRPPATSPTINTKHTQDSANTYPRGRGEGGSTPGEMEHRWSPSIRQSAAEHRAILYAQHTNTPVTVPTGEKASVLTPR